MSNLPIFKRAGEEVLDYLPQALREFIQAAPEWFLSGSRRFGYNTEESDWDFIVYRPECKGPEDLPVSPADCTGVHGRGEGYADGHVLNFTVQTPHGTINCIVQDDIAELERWRLSLNTMLNLRAMGMPLNRDVSALIHQTIWEAAGCVN